MRIGIDGRLWNETGVGRYIRNVVKEIAELDSKNTYCLFVLSKDLEKIQNSKFKIQNERWKIVPADIHWHSVKEQFAFLKIVNKENLDLIHFPYISVPVFYNKPFVITIHDLIPYHFPTGKASRLPEPVYEFKNQMYRFVIHAAAARAKAIITPLNATKKDVVDTLKITESKIYVTYEGVDKDLLYADQVSSEIKQFVKEKKYFLYVGNTYPHKNVERMINAFIQLQKKEKLPVSLLLVGKDDYFYQKVKRAVKKVDSISFMHTVSDNELSYLYQHAVSVIVPSLLEGFGLPAIEAMANDCLVIASDIPVFKEVCGQAAFYVDPYSEEALLSKMVAVYNLSSESKKEKLTLGKKRLPHFSWKNMTTQTLSIYESCIGVRPSE